MPQRVRRRINEIRALHYQMLAHHARGELAEYFRCNQEIHLKLVEASGNEPLAEVYRSLNAHVRRARYMANYSRERWDEAVREHEEMLRALTSATARRSSASCASTSLTSWCSSWRRSATGRRGAR